MYLFKFLFIVCLFVSLLLITIGLRNKFNMQIRVTLCIVVFCVFFLMYAWFMCPDAFYDVLIYNIQGVQ